LEEKIMASTKSSIKVEQFIPAPVSQVYRAFTNSTAMREWMCDFATLEAKPSGRLYAWWRGDYYTCGEFLSLEIDKKVIFTWHGRGEPRPTQVIVAFTPTRKGTLVRLTHRRIGSGKVWENAPVVFESEWKSSLENLASVLGNGPDLRITHRPMLGISLSDFNADIAKKLGIPVNHGVRLDGVIDGMGAKAAGLQKDDLLVEFAGQELLDNTSLSSAVQGKKAGDTVLVTFYRGPEKITTELTLFSRPIPDIPSSLAELSTEVGKAYAQAESQMASYLQGVSEQEAAYKSTPQEWSIKEVIAHLIHSERGWQNVIAEIASGVEASYDSFGGNLDARNQATITAFPSLADLQVEWKRLNTETIALLAYLPEEFTQRRGSYWRLAYQCLYFPTHFFTHLEQMQAALQSTRKME
jgi:uncharacterized protein YndB with AHSA1/START domain/uncharacterized damage-inducible protein DinB